MVNGALVHLRVRVCLSCNLPSKYSKDTTAALDAAIEASKTWQHTTAKYRSNCCVKHVKLLAALTALQGTPLAEARGEIGYENFLSGLVRRP